MGATVALTLAACATNTANEGDIAWAAYPETSPLPTAAPATSTPHDNGSISWVGGFRHDSVAGLRDASAIVAIVTPTGETSSVLVEQGAESDDRVSMVMAEFVLVRPAGKGAELADQGDAIWIVESIPGRRTLPTAGYSKVFVYEFVYWLSDERPADGPIVYALTGGQQGLWVDAEGRGEVFTKTDPESPALPETITATDGDEER